MEPRAGLQCLSSGRKVMQLKSLGYERAYLKSIRSMPDLQMQGAGKRGRGPLYEYNGPRLFADKKAWFLLP